MRVGRRAAGIGRRIGGASPPLRVPLHFGGETLIVRHAVILCHCGAERIDRIVGYRAPEIEGESEVYFRLHPLPTGPASRAAQPGARP
jgi:hypothetical protein